MRFESVNKMRKKEIWCFGASWDLHSYVNNYKNNSFLKDINKEKALLKVNVLFLKHIQLYTDISKP